MSPSPALFERAFDASPSPIAIVGPEGKVVYANAACRWLFGPREGSSEPLAVADVVVEEDRAQVGAEMYRLATGQIDRIQMEHRARTVDGAVIWVEVRASLVDDDRSGPVMVAHIQDISERHRFRREIERRERLLLDTQELASTGSYEWDLAADRMTWSQTLFHMIGLEPGRVRPSLEALLDRVHPDDRSVVEQTVAASLATGTPWSFSFRMVAASGDTICVETSSRVERGVDGEVSKVFGVAVDVTERRRLEKRLRHQLELENLVGSISARFARVGEGEEDSCVRETLGEIGRFAGADRAYLFLFSEDGRSMSNTHEWCEPGTVAQIDDLQDLPVDTFPWWMERLREDAVIDEPRVADLPAEAATEREMLQAERVLSVLGAPIWSGSRLRGFVAFGAVAEMRRWSPDDVRLLRSAGAAFVPAVERRRSREALEEAERHLARAQRVARMGSWEADVPGQHLYLSEEAFAVLGRCDERDDFDGRIEWVLELVPPDDRAALVESIEATISSGRRFEHEHRVILPDGRVRHIREEGEPDHDDEGNLVRVVGTLRDVTDLRLSQERLREAEHRYRTLFEAADELVFSWDGDARVVSANPAAAAALGYSPDSLLGRGIPELIEPRYRDEARAVNERFFSGEEPEPLRVPVRHRDGHTVWLEGRAHPLRDLDGAVTEMVVIVRDVTDG